MTDEIRSVVLKALDDYDGQSDSMKNMLDKIRNAEAAALDLEKTIEDARVTISKAQVERDKIIGRISTLAEIISEMAALA